MRRLVFLVEGDTELIFINNHVIPYFYSIGFLNPMQAQKVTTNRQMQKKGGIQNYDYLKNDIRRVLGQGNVIITTFIDFFKLPTSFPGYSPDSSKISAIEEAVHQDLNSHQFILPYIQRHEIEALMYSNMEGFDIVVDDIKKLKQLRSIIEEYDNPEDINTRPLNSPSKRLENIFRYDKTYDGELILEAIGIQEMIRRCPRFCQWINKLERILRIP